MKLSNKSREKILFQISKHLKNSRKKKITMSTEVVINLLQGEINDETIVNLAKEIMPKNDFELMVMFLDIKLPKQEVGNYETDNSREANTSR